MSARQQAMRAAAVEGTGSVSAKPSTSSTLSFDKEPEAQSAQPIDGVEREQRPAF
jgi:hypothetical protein